MVYYNHSRDVALSEKHLVKKKRNLETFYVVLASLN